MAPDRFQNLRDLFDAALALTPVERPAFLRDSCTGDPSLQSDLQRLLASHDQAAGFLEAPAAGPAPLDEASYLHLLLNDRFRVDQRLGAGGFGVVYMARDTHLHDKPLVVKILRERLHRRDWFEKKFRHECRAMAAINHPGVVGILDQGHTPDGRPFLAMEFVPGTALSTVLDQGPLPLPRAARLLRQIGQALGAAHDQGVLHRDLKPANIILRDLGGGQEFPVIIDFGVATIKDPNVSQIKTTGVAGSYPYMAPEQLLGHPEAASDIYALGVIACEMVTGRRPFDAESPIALLYEIRKGIPFQPRALRPGLPEPAERIILQALSYDPPGRPPHPLVFCSELESALAAPPPEPLLTRLLRAFRLLLVLLAISPLPSQTTQGLIAGRIVDSQTGAGIPSAEVSYASPHTSGAASADRAGYYVLPLLSPGLYRLRVTAPAYQAQELQQLDLPVAARLDVQFRLRPLSDVWEAGQFRSVFLPNSEAVVTFYGPDVDTSRFGSFEATKGRRGALESTVSQVIDPAQIRNLPLAGRDVYTMLVTQPGVTADTTTARGLGLSINGQRPSASNFLLDGLENNNYLVTGPLTPIAPEAVQEYRVSTSSFSAEYGRTAGFLANAVTRAGGPAWHGLGYWYLKNDALNANGFQQNRLGQPRSPLHEHQYGFQAGGPLLPRRLFFSSALEHLRSRGRAEPFDFLFPSTRFNDFTAPDAYARRLLSQFPAPAVTDRNLPTARLTLSPPVSVDRTLALERLDYQAPSSRHRLMGRLAIARLGRPDFIWTPYPDFISPLTQNTWSLAGTLVTTLRPNLTNEARAGFSRDDLHWDRPHPEIPTLFSADGVYLPGSPAFYEYRNHASSFEFSDNLLWARGRHILKFGAGFLLRRLDGHLTAGRDGLYVFGDILDFSLDAPTFFSVAVARPSLPNLRLPDYPRSYRYNQFHLFAQDTFRLTSRLTLNYGLRYETFGAPLPDYAADRNNAALRFGFSYDLRGTLLRGAYGIFYDRPFENLWQNVRNNDLVLAGFPLPFNRTNYLASIPSVLPSYQGRRFNTDFPPLTKIQPDLRDAYAQHYFFGLQRRLTDNWAVELNTLGALGRKLITTDSINRPFSVRPDSVSNPDGRLYPALPPISYRANQGASNYHALAATARYRFLHVAYTWSHSIDNQSEPLAGDFFDLSFTRITSGSGRAAISSFSRQFDFRTDRGSSDFDQRHNLVFYSLWNLPRGFQFSQLAAFRTGFPYTVTAPSRFAADGEWIINNRADIVAPVRDLDTPTPGGRLLLDRASFREPAPGRLGNSGRNLLSGPGLFNVDLSVSRSFRLHEKLGVTLRADAFNFLNHANLNNPEFLLTSDQFGVALYGRRGRESGFPALAPLNETARQFQLLLRVEF